MKWVQEVREQLSWIQTLGGKGSTKGTGRTKGEMRAIGRKVLSGRKGSTKEASTAPQSIQQTTFKRHKGWEGTWDSEIKAWKRHKHIMDLSSSSEEWGQYRTPLGNQSAVIREGRKLSPLFSLSLGEGRLPWKKERQTWFKETETPKGRNNKRKPRYLAIQNELQN